MTGKILSFIARVAIAFVCLLPLRAVANMGRGFGHVAYYLDGRHRRVATRNLGECFGESKTPREISEIAHENFRRIGENICCGIKSTSLDDRALGQMLEVKQGAFARSVENIEARNVVLASGHFGAFELLSRLGPHFPHYRQAATYRGIRQSALNSLLLGMREKWGMSLFERRAGAEYLKKALSEGGLMLILLSDQSDRFHGLPLPFLGRTAYTNRAPAVMAARYGGVLFVPICYRVALGQYRIEMGEAIPSRNENGSRRSCEAITRDVNSAYETAILRDPSNWFWVHNRWKQRGLPKRESVAARNVEAAPERTRARFS
jgi:KDO2-lipid IV(A) lauroyltransferase